MKKVSPGDTPAAAKDEPLRDDIRLLGRILGDTVRAFDGAAAFDLIERVRALSIRCHRDEDIEARRELHSLLAGLVPAQTNQVIRAFSYFSHLANIAEDQHHIRRARSHAPSPARARAKAALPIRSSAP
jgi:phosphoenolpyruvate carboxylase